MYHTITEMLILLLWQYLSSQYVYKYIKQSHSLEKYFNTK